MQDIDSHSGELFKTAESVKDLSPTRRSATVDYNGNTIGK